MILLLALALLGGENESVYLTKAEALKIALPGADRVGVLELVLSAAQQEAVAARLKSGLPGAALTVYVGRREGEVVGYAVITEEKGKFQPITFIVGASPGFQVTDVAVMVYRETHGDQVKGRRFLNQFQGMDAGDPVRRGKDVTNISGATISVDSMCRGVRRVLATLEAVGRPTLDQEEERAISDKRLVMGGLCTITAYGRDERGVRAAIGEAFDALKAADRLLSDYDEQSELSRLNAAGTMKVSPELLNFLRVSKEAGEASGGAFDITVGPLVRLWGFRGGEPRLPSDADLEAALAAVGSSRIVLDGGSATLPKGALLDPGGIGKGWGVDRGVERLKAAGVTRALVDFGSTMRALGPPPGEEGWNVGIRDPFGEGLLGRLLLRDGSLNTSGGYERQVEIGGKTYGHVIDPRNGRPVEGMAQASVLTPTGTEGDFLSTAVFVLGPERGLELVKRRNAEVLIVTSDPKAARPATEGWTARFSSGAK